MSMKQYIVGLLAILGIFAGGYAAIQYNQDEFSVGGDAVSPIAGQTYTLAGSGISSSETSFTLTSFTITQTGYPIQDSDMSDIFYVTFEPGSRSRQEIASCTTVTQNSDGTATISGCTRGLMPITPYTASTSLQFAHAGGSTVIFSDPPQLFNQAAFKTNDETITGSWLFPTPLSNENAATKAYVDALVSGTTTLTNEAIVVAGTAGETLATSTLVYFNPTTQRWNGVTSAATTTFDDRFIGLTQGSGTNGNAVTGGILLKGRHTKSTGLTPGALYYAASATGTISTATSSQTVGVAVSATVLYFDPIWIDVPTENGDNTFTGTNTFSGTVAFTSLITGHASTSIRVYTASSTWTKPAGLEYITVWVCGGGAGGSGGDDTTTDTRGAGGGGGGCAFEILDSNELSSTSSVAVVIGAGGTGGAGNGGFGGTNGGTSQFGTFLSATGGSSAGTGSSNDIVAGGAGGTGSGGDFNLQGTPGGEGASIDRASASGFGGSSFFGGGAAGVRNSTGSNGGNYGGGGSGGDGSGNDRDGGAGSSGIVIITEYY